VHIHNDSMNKSKPMCGENGLSVVPAVQADAFDEFFGSMDDPDRHGRLRARSLDRLSLRRFDRR
jgi:hypothetical protein